MKTKKLGKGVYQYETTYDMSLEQFKGQTITITHYPDHVPNDYMDEGEVSKQAKIGIFDSTTINDNPEEIAIRNERIVYIKKLFTSDELDILKGNVSIEDIAKEKGVLVKTIQHSIAVKKEKIKEDL